MVVTQFLTQCFWYSAERSTIGTNANSKAQTEVWLFVNQTGALDWRGSPVIVGLLQAEERDAHKNLTVERKTPISSRAMKAAIYQIRALVACERCRPKI